MANSVVESKTSEAHRGSTVARGKEQPVRSPRQDLRNQTRGLGYEEGSKILSPEGGIHERPLDGRDTAAVKAPGASSNPGGRILLTTTQEKPFKLVSLDTKVMLPRGTRVYVDADPRHFAQAGFIFTWQVCSVDVEKSTVLGLVRNEKTRATIEANAITGFVRGTLPVDAFDQGDMASASELDGYLKNLDATTLEGLDPKIESLWSRLKAPERREDTARLVIEAVLKAPVLTGGQIASVRKWIGRLTNAGQKAAYYEQVAQKTGYRNQRNNEGRLGAAGDSMCNVTSLAMAFETAGITQEKVADTAIGFILANGTANGMKKLLDRMKISVKDDLLSDIEKREELRAALKAQMLALQYEDLLDAFLMLHGLNRFQSTDHQKASFIILHGSTDFSSKEYQKHEKENRIAFGAGSSTETVKKFFLETVLPRLKAGAGATLSSQNFGNYGHFVRLQWVDESGVTIDDPYGAFDVAATGNERARWKQTNAVMKENQKSATTLAEETEGAVGQDNRLTWTFLAKYGGIVNLYG